MATTSTIVQEKQAETQPVLPVVIAVTLGVIISVALIGGAGYYLIHSGKLRLQAMPPATASTQSVKTHAVALEPLVVNLADASGAAYLRVSITLHVADDVAGKPKDERKPEEGKSTKESDAVVRDTALAVLGTETSDNLLASDGKERVKKRLKDALATSDPDMKVVDLYFTEFLVQR
jgi:flagellar FliL protein